MLYFDKNILPFLTEDQLLGLVRFIESQPKNFMAHELSLKLNMEWSKSMSTISVLWAKKLVDVFLLIYHDCDSSLPVETVEYGKGLPQLPWTCPNCKSLVNNFSEINFDLMAKPKLELKAE